MTDLRERSKARFESLTKATFEEIQTGCLQRIADNSDVLNNILQKLIEDKTKAEYELEFYKKLAKDRLAQINHLKLSNGGYKGVIAKLKKKLNEKA